MKVKTALRCEMARWLTNWVSMNVWYRGCENAVLREGLRRRWREDRVGEKERESWTAMEKRK